MIILMDDNGWIGGWINGWVGRQIQGRIGRWMHGLRSRWRDEAMMVDRDDPICARVMFLF